MNNNRNIPNAWRILILLFLANLLNFFDRAIPAIIIEPIRKEWGLSDMQLGLAAAAFILVYAVAGLPLGRFADTHSRKTIVGWGLTAWSGFTALNALAWSYMSFLFVRVGVGVGEASFAPAANSMIGDLFPPERRARAIGIFMLGLPLGSLLAFVTVGWMVDFFGTWRAPFLISAIPGLILAFLIFSIREPVRGASDAVVGNDLPISQPFLSLLRIKTFRWLIASGVTLTIAGNAGAAFLVPLMQRHFEQSMTNAGIRVGLIIGATGLVGLLVGGWLADALHKKYRLGRMLFGVVGLLFAGLFTGAGLLFCSNDVTLFTVLFGCGWLMLFSYYTSAYPAIQDIVQPRQRATAIGLYFALMYIFGGAFGPLMLGAISDHLAQQAMLTAGTMQMTESFKAVGLYGAMYLIPVVLLLTSVFLALATRSYLADAESMKKGQ
ncbi:MFS transporter [Pseudomonas sp. P1B16]|uniref:MFS transporter n=2 Tax=Pseudomonas TaxID=286 RepID=A0A6G6ISN9_PSENT|nr:MULTISPECIES: MFS transporter [Pseudomonas]HCE6397604.1 MFS transporter [Pseudomonas aeruginosa]NWD83128.1 MFS transporter [Pseudomonas reactans]NWE92349.1 MFS transporter [Pseudomonas reactans]QIE86069.1 MFS transporter [Pseudomonas nitroreducens]WPM25667.1 MFS transporter [Pseudomonas sp. P1B16]